jgi:hypothetical protein
MRSFPRHLAVAMQHAERPTGKAGQPLWVIGLVAVVICLAFLGLRLSG